MRRFTSKAPTGSTRLLLFLVVSWGLGADMAGKPSNAHAEDRAPETGPSVPDVSAFQNLRKTQGDLAAVETLLKAAREGCLAPPLLEHAAGLLGHQDPFVSGMAEWAIAAQIGYENNGVRQLWPPPDPPSWYAKWVSVSSQQSAERDYVRQAVARGIHRDPQRLQESVAQVADRAQAVAATTRGAKTSHDTRIMIEQQLDRLAQLRDETDALVRSGDVQVAQLRSLWLEARRVARPVVLANPALSFDDVLFVTQFTGHMHRNITRVPSWFHKPGGDICRMHAFRSSGDVTRLLDGRLGPGYVWGLDLWWDADRVVFGYVRQPRWPPAVLANLSLADQKETFPGEGLQHQMRQEQEPIHLYELRLDGGDLRQMTDHDHWSDFEPAYCPNGDVVFASDRSGEGSQCSAITNDVALPKLFILSADGKRIRRFTFAKDIERYPHCLDNGLIAFVHWEYQERHFFEIHSVWSARPDGTMADAVFKQHMPAPFGLRDTRSVPGSSKLVSIATGHHTFAHGPVVLVDSRNGMNSVSGIEIVTPGVCPQEGKMSGQPVPQGGVPDAGGLYRHPWALSDTCFLACYAYDQLFFGGYSRAFSNGFGLYLIDVWGNKELIYRHPILSCAFPSPCRKRPRPPIPSSTRPIVNHSAVCFLADVYRDLEGVPRGTVKHLRVAQHLGWPNQPKTGVWHYHPGSPWDPEFGIWSWSPVRVIGTVRVEEDGSACFRVPANQGIYFQALDEDYMEVRRMRAMVGFQPGEVRGCVGCHESQAVTAPLDAGRLPIALAREPEMPEPPPWGNRKALGYEWLVQPILDRHCVRCHGADDPEGDLDFTSTRAPDGFYQSYRTMFGVAPGEETSHWKVGQASGSRPALVSIANRHGGGGVSRPEEFGSRRSGLVRALLDDPLHCDEVRLNSEEWLSLVTWVDANGPYYAGYIQKRSQEGTPLNPPRRVALQLPDPFAPP